MAKLNKQKFNLAGSYTSSRTTFSGDIELYLHYETDKEYFYFDQTELTKYFKKEDIPSVSNYFGLCDTKTKAIAAMKAFIVRGGVETKYLRVKMGIPSRFWKVNNPNFDKNNRLFGDDEVIPNPKLPEYLTGMLEQGSMYSHSGLALDFIRVIKLDVNGAIHFVEAKEDWSYDTKYLSGYSGHLLEWSEAREQFLIDTQNKLDDICDIVINFMNAGESVESLFQRMEASSKMLEIGSGEKK